MQWLLVYLFHTEKIGKSNQQLVDQIIQVFEIQKNCIISKNIENNCLCLDLS